MKILQLISSAGFFGAENVVLELSRELNLQNIENIIGTFENLQNPHTEIVNFAKENNSKIIIFKCDGKIDLKTLYDIKKFVKANKIDVIHTHGYKSNTYGFVVARILKKPIVATCHNWIANDYKTKIYYLLDKNILPKFDKIIAVSYGIEAELLRNRARRDRTILIYNGVNINKFGDNKRNLRREFNIGDKTKIIGTVCRFTFEKGLFNLLEAALEITDKFPDVVFLLVGDGPLRNDLEKESIEFGMRGRVIFAGMRSDMPELYSTFDIFILPSLKEGLPMVLLEAMAAKKPVIATRVGAIPQVIENSQDGILIEPNNINELKEAIFRLLKDEGFAKRLAQNAHNKVSNEFSSKAMCERYLEIYGEVLLNRTKSVCSLNTC